MAWKPGERNLITDVAGLKVGSAEDAELKSGATVLTAQEPFAAGVHVMGGAPGTRETDLLAPDRTVGRADALVLAGGSAFGLDAASGVADGLRAMGRGFALGAARVPIVPAAILFDLLNGGRKDWVENPYARLGRSALEAADGAFALGSAGAGFGAATADLKGGLGSASLALPSGQTVGALVAVNSLGSAVVAGGPHFWAAPFEIGGEFGGRGPASSFPAAGDHPVKGRPSGSTTIGVVATDAALSPAECTRLAVAAHDGIARAVAPSHTPMDGDLVFAAATGTAAQGDLPELCHAGALCMARAIARAVFAATPAPGDLLPCWRGRFGAG